MALRRRGPPASHRFQAQLAGACSWTIRFDIIEVDQVELLEELPAKGSYAYLSFDRIDYTYDGGKVVLGEAAFH